MPLPSFVLPGTTLGTTSSSYSGPGTYIHNSNIIASIKGKPSVLAPPGPASATSKPTISVNTPVASLRQIPSRNVTRRNVLPSVNAVVLAKVTRLQQRQANVAIVVVNETVCADEFAGMVRREDVRGWEVDRVKVEEMFRVGDVIRAVVISLGDQSSYYLSTARNELGVLLATSEIGNQMYPVSWKEFRDPETGKHEARKVAKPI
ncbi:exosome 3'-_5 exonuclease subunit ski4 (Csl4) [Thelotrema lepadinum]|nr:exosome 3'->5 exonuclease subunit ski4 (Csl4) [Thelotrema lepadinum]